MEAQPQVQVQQPAAVDPADMPDSHLPLSIVSCVCCNCCCFGLVALVFAIQSNSSLNAGMVSTTTVKVRYSAFHGTSQSYCQHIDNFESAAWG